jgi:hypothetical protein
MSQRNKIQLEQLTALEAEFNETLILCLKQCANGKWGLFGAYERFPEAEQWAAWPEARRLHELAISIRELLAQSGEKGALVEEFLNLRSMHGPNDPGEPKLARAFLKRIEKVQVETSSRNELT